MSRVSMSTVFLVVCLLLAGVVYGEQKCRLYNDFLTELVSKPVEEIDAVYPQWNAIEVLSFCKNVAGWHVNSKDDLFAKNSQAQQWFEYYSSMMVKPSKTCKNRLKRLVCSQFLRECVIPQQSESLTFLRPCASVCGDFEEACDAYLREPLGLGSVCVSELDEVTVLDPETQAVVTRKACNPGHRPTKLSKARTSVMDYIDLINSQQFYVVFVVLVAVIIAVIVTKTFIKHNVEKSKRD